MTNTDDTMPAAAPDGPDDGEILLRGAGHGPRSARLRAHRKNGEGCWMRRRREARRQSRAMQAEHTSAVTPSPPSASKVRRHSAPFCAARGSDNRACFDE